MEAKKQWIAPEIIEIEINSAIGPTSDGVGDGGKSN